VALLIGLLADALNTVQISLRSVHFLNRAISNSGLPSFSFLWKLLKTTN